MLKKIVANILLAILFVSSAFADQAVAPAGGVRVNNLAHQTDVSTKRDPRIRYLTYGENTVYRFDLSLKFVNAVQFSDEEQIESILIGDSASWEIVKLKNGHVISIKAIIPSALTNMTVYTNRRVYTFELQSLGDKRPTSTSPFRTVFTYPVERKAKEVQDGEPPRWVNVNYLISGKASFRPVQVQDDGRQTWFVLPSGAPRPAIFKVGKKNTEQLVNSRTQGRHIVVDGVADYWVLRIGDQYVCVGKQGAVSTNPRVTINKPLKGKHAVARGRP